MAVDGIHIQLPLPPLLIHCPIVITQKRDRETYISRKEYILFPCKPHPGRCATRTPEAQDQQSPPEPSSLPPLDGLPCPLCPPLNSLTLSFFPLQPRRRHRRRRSFQSFVHSLNPHTVLFFAGGENRLVLVVIVLVLCSPNPFARPCAPDRPLTIPAAAPFTTIFSLFSTI